MGNGKKMFKREGGQGRGKGERKGKDKIEGKHRHRGFINEGEGDEKKEARCISYRYRFPVMKAILTQL